mmetsp:Transcript_6866/g.20064  ORF Transcript_6866/g.20064 Transcript_6866/m.20064 type:complete len:260 (-) Transcript_6866:192-971(-)
MSALVHEALAVSKVHWNGEILFDGKLEDIGLAGLVSPDFDPLRRVRAPAPPHANAAFRAVYVQLLLGLGPGGVGCGPHALLAKPQGDDSRHVSPRLVQACAGVDALQLLVAKREEQPCQWIHSQVEQAPPAHLELVKPLHLERNAEAKVCRASDDFPELPRLEEGSNLPRRWEAPRPHSLHEKQVLLLREGHHLPHLSSIHADRLLAKHVLSLVQRLHHKLAVRRVNRADVHHIDLSVLEEAVIPPIVLWNPKRFGKTF